jgi:uncharacterized damage-inducible protein DinB
VTMLNWLRRLYDAVFWADGRVLDSLDDGDVAARRYFHHLLAAERVWLLRLRGEDSSGQAIWPELTETEARSMATENQEGYRRYLEHLSENDLEGWVEYANQSGRRYRTATADILTHVAMHGAYHRGQIARAKREAGGVPVNTDFITYVRELDNSVDARPVHPDPTQ